MHFLEESGIVEDLYEVVYAALVKDNTLAETFWVFRKCVYSMLPFCDHIHHVQGQLAEMRYRIE